jgi:serine/threonine-protein kinase
MTSGQRSAFASLLRQRRVERGLSQEELAERAGLSLRGISDLERGVSRRPRLHTARLLADALELGEGERAAFLEMARDGAGYPTEQFPDESSAEHRLPVGNFLGAIPAGELVERDDEMDRIGEALDAAAEDRGGFVLIAGEHGIGKTRLAQEVSVEARSRGFLVATGRCYESRRDLTYYPLLEALAHLLHAAPPAVRLSTDRRWPHLARLLPDELLSDPTPAVDPQEEEARLYRAVTGFVVACSQIAPVALLFDDLQWADDRSLDLLAHLAHNTRAARVMILGTCVDADLSSETRPGRLVRELSRERLLDRVTLHRLPIEGTASLISSIMGESVVSAELVELVQRCTKGRPLFVEEMVRALGGRYRLVRELGAGGMARVFRAIDVRDDSPVAVKILFASTDAGIDALLRFQQEGAVLSTLKHPNIVEVKGTFLEDYVSCIIMELLEGRSLTQVLRDEELDLNRIKHILSQVAAALAYAHARNIVHRDIKPDNIMVEGNNQVKVTDFGIARVLRSGATLNTATGMRIGTPLYMAPEQIEGREVDARADIYSVGAILYQMVTGRPPFEGPDPITTIVKQLRDAPQPPAEVAASLPPDWEDLILRLLAKDAGDRVQTAQALKEAVEALSTEPVAPGLRSRLARRRTPTPRPAPGRKTPTHAPTPPAGSAARGVESVGARLWALPNRILAAAAGTVTVAVIATSVFVWQSASSSPSSPPRGLTAVAGWGGPTTANRTDTAIRSSSGGVLVSNAFPDGRTTARCFIEVTTSSGTQRTRYGDCSGVSLDVTCASAPYNLSSQAPSRIGASLSVDGRRAWTGAYDQGTSPPCPNHPKGVNDSLAARLSGTTTGQNLVWLVGGDNQGHVGNPTSTQRSGCFEYTETAGASSAHCVQTDFSKGPGSFYYEARSHGGSGVLVETGNSANIRGDLTLQGVFVEAPGRPGVIAEVLNRPAGVAVDAQGNAYVVDSRNNLVRKFSPTGAPIQRWGGTGAQPLSNPQAVAVDSRGNIYVADQNNNRVLKLAQSGRPISPWGTGDSGPGKLNAPIALALDADGNVWVLDAGSPPLHELSPDGTLIKQVQPGDLSGAAFGGIALGRGHFYVTAGSSDGVSVFSSSTISPYPIKPVATFGTLGSGRDQFRFPNGIALDEQGDIYVADTGNNRIVVLSPSGEWLFAVGTRGSHPGQFNAPTGIAVDGHGNVYVADTNNNWVQKFAPRE